MDVNSANVKVETPQQRRDRLEYHRKYYTSHKESQLSKSRAEYPLKREQKIASVKAYRLNNLEKVRERKREYRRTHLDRENDRAKKWQRDHSEYRSRYMKEYKRRNSAKCRTINQNRRSLVKAATINLRRIETWMKFILNKQSAVCYWCQTMIPRSSIHFDHIIPLIRGGQHSVENLCVSCVKCNLSKNSKTPRIWIKTGQQFLEL